MALFTSELGGESVAPRWRPACSAAKGQRVAGLPVGSPRQPSARSAWTHPAAPTPTRGASTRASPGSPRASRRRARSGRRRPGPAARATWRCARKSGPSGHEPQRANGPSRGGQPFGAVGEACRSDLFHRPYAMYVVQALLARQQRQRPGRRSGTHRRPVDRAVVVLLDGAEHGAHDAVHPSHAVARVRSGFASAEAAPRPPGRAWRAGPPSPCACVAV